MKDTMKITVQEEKKVIEERIIEFNSIKIQVTDFTATGPDGRTYFLTKKERRIGPSFITIDEEGIHLPNNFKVIEEYNHKNK